MVPALMNLEANFTVTPHVLEGLRSVATPEAAKALISVMLKDKVSRKELDAHIATVVHDMYVDWHWCIENPYIHPDKRMPSFPALAGVSYGTVHGGGWWTVVRFPAQMEICAVSRTTALLCRSLPQ